MQFYKAFKKNGFTLAEALVMLLMSSIVIMATMPVITKKIKIKKLYRPGPSDGWVCTREQMPCTFHPPARARSFSFLYDEDPVPSFACVNMGTITIVKQCGPNIKNFPVSMDEYKNGEVKIRGTYCINADKVRILY